MESPRNCSRLGRTCWTCARLELGGPDRSLVDTSCLHQPIACARIWTSRRQLSLPGWRRCSWGALRSVGHGRFLEKIRGGVQSRVEFAWVDTCFESAVRRRFQHHAKANLLGENAGKHGYLPAVSLGFVARTEVRRVGGVFNSKDTHNEDVYLVATKTITYFKFVPIVSSLGFKVTNASVLGIAGNAPNWQGRLFGTLGFVVPGPVNSKIVLGSEFLQEPRHIEGLPGATTPTTLTYFARVIPRGELPLNVDFGVAQVANKILPGVDLRARSQFAVGVSYRF